jgi:hypothetical protein
MAPAAFTFFLHVGDFSAGRDFAVAADDASASECREAEETNETHTILRQSRSNICAAANAHVASSNALATLHISAMRVRKNRLALFGSLK